MSSEINHTLDLSAKAGFVFGQGCAIQAVNTMVADIARTDIAVLLIGESAPAKKSSRDSFMRGHRGGLVLSLKSIALRFSDAAISLAGQCSRTRELD